MVKYFTLKKQKLQYIYYSMFGNQWLESAVAWEKAA